MKACKKWDGCCKDPWPFWPDHWAQSFPCRLLNPFSSNALVVCASLSHGESIKAELSLALARPPRYLLLLGIENLYCWALGSSQWPASSVNLNSPSETQAKPHSLKHSWNKIPSVVSAWCSEGEAEHGKLGSVLPQAFRKLLAARPRAMFITKLKPKQNLSRFGFLHERLDQVGMYSAGIKEEMESALKGQFHIHWNHMQNSQGSKLKLLNTATKAATTVLCHSS